MPILGLLFVYLEGMKHITLLLALLACTFSYGQKDSIASFDIALILPFQTEETKADIHSFMNAPDYFTANRVMLDEDAQASLDFYQGMLLALNQDTSNIRINLRVYDNNNSDSITKLILAKPELKKQDIIIGTVNYASAKSVAEFCKANKIINVQPFTPSKSLTLDNPYHIKLAPTIDAHIDNMFQSVVDSFPIANVIIFSPDNETEWNAAKRLDSLFKEYNKSAALKYTVTLLNSKTMTVAGKKVTNAELLKQGKRNIWMITSFEESFANGNLRVMFPQIDKYDLIVYGMPTWLGGDVMRLDYVNSFHTRLTYPFYADTTGGRAEGFISSYKSSYHIEPSQNAYLGYDVANFLARTLAFYGMEFPDLIATQRYTGLGYKFDIMKQRSPEGKLNYFENRHVNVFKIEDYKLQKVW